MIKVYAQLNRHKYEEMPPEWREVDGMFKFLRDRAMKGGELGYQMVFYKNVFGAFADYKCSLVKWSRRKRS